MKTHNSSSPSRKVSLEALKALDAIIYSIRRPITIAHPVWGKNKEHLFTLKDSKYITVAIKNDPTDGDVYYVPTMAGLDALSANTRSLGN